MTKRIVSLCLAVLISILTALVFLPVVLFRIFPHTSNARLQRVANIATTYGVVATVVTGISVGLVAVSLILQAAESRASRLQNLRSLHVDLLKMSLEDSTLLDTWGDFSTSSSPKLRRQHIYVNLIVQHWRLMYELGALSREQLSSMAEDLMSGTPGRRYWEDSECARLEANEGDVFGRKFAGVLQKAYELSVHT